MLSCIMSFLLDFGINFELEGRHEVACVITKPQTLSQKMLGLGQSKMYFD